MKRLITIIAVLILASCQQPAEITPEMRMRNLVVLTELLTDDLAQRVRGTVDYSEKEDTHTVTIIKPSSIFNYEMCAMNATNMINSYSDIDIIQTWRRHIDGYYYMTARMDENETMDRYVDIFIYFYRDENNLAMAIKYEE